MKKTSKKIIGGLTVFMLIATIGAVVTSAHPGFFPNLTDEQKEELKDLKEELKEEATSQEMREAMETQLEEYGVELPTREEMIDQRIENAEKRLEILSITKDLIQENPEITQEEIRETLEEDYGIEMQDCEGKMSRRGFYGGHRGFMHGEESE